MGRRVPRSGSNTSPFESPALSPWLEIFQGSRRSCIEARGSTRLGGTLLPPARLRTRLLAPSSTGTADSEDRALPIRALTRNCWGRRGQSKAKAGGGKEGRSEASRALRFDARARRSPEIFNQGEGAGDSKGDVFEPERATLFPTAEPGRREPKRPRRTHRVSAPRRIIRVSVREGPTESALANDPPTAPASKRRTWPPARDPRTPAGRPAARRRCGS